MANGRRQFTDWIKEIIVNTVAGIITALIFSLASLKVWGELGEEARRLGTRVIFISYSIITSALAFVWLWAPARFSRLGQYFRRWRTSLLLRSLLTFAIMASLGLVLAREFSNQGGGETAEVYKLFPQAKQYGPAVIRTYATNGISLYSFHDESPPFGPQNGYARITFHVYGNTVAQNAGWVMFLQRGVDISRFNELRFLIRGEKGNENIGIKAKDARGVEIELILDGTYLRHQGLSATWQEADAVVPLAHLGNVDFGLFENFSFFTTGVLAGSRPQTFYVGQFELR